MGVNSRWSIDGMCTNKLTKHMSRRHNNNASATASLLIFFFILVIVIAWTRTGTPPSPS